MAEPTSPSAEKAHECIHCGQHVNDEGRDLRGSLTCDEFAADPDMQGENHDWNLRALSTGKTSDDG